MKSLELILEKDEGEIWGRVDAPGFLYTTSGETVEEIEKNMRELIADFLENEGKSQPEWQGVSINDLAFEITYDLTAFFTLFNELNISAIAERAGINASLMRQYTSGIKHPAEQQVKKIAAAIHELGKKLQTVTLA